MERRRERALACVAAGPGNSSPIVWGNRVLFTSGQSGEPADGDVFLTAPAASCFGNPA